MRLIQALNAINTPILSIIVILVGIGAQKSGIDSTTSATIIGAGIGLLTGQALTHKAVDPATPDPLAPTK